MKQLRIHAGKIGLALLLLAAATVLIYANSLPSPFLYDDIKNITENPHIRVTELSPSSLTQVLKSRSTNRPFANLTFALNYYFHQYHVFGYHLVNLLIHLITAGLIFGLARQTLALCRQKTTWPAFLAALLWLVNPLHTQSVTYIVQRMNALAALFYLLTMVCYIQARRIQQRADTGQTRPMLLFAAGAISAVLALASKEIAATLPVLLFLYEWYFFQDLDADWLKRQAKWIGGALIILAAAGFLYLGDDPIQRLMAGYTRQSFTPGQRLLSEPRVIVYYLSLLCFPHPGRLTLIYDFPVSASVTAPLTTVLALITLAALIILAGYTARRQRLISFAVLWFLGTLLVESSFIGLALIFEHRTYLPSVFIAIALVWWLRGYLRPWPTAISLLIGMVAISGFWTYQRNQIWQNEISIWKDVTTKAPFHASAYNDLGQAFQKRKNYQQALICFERSLRLRQGKAPIFTYHNIGEIMLRMGRFKEAISYLKKIPQEDPLLNKVSNAPAFSKNAPTEIRLIQTGDSFVDARRRDLYKKTCLNLGIARQQLGKPGEAIKHYKQALLIDPTFEKAWNNLGNAFFSLGTMNKAQACFNKALVLNPEYEQARANQHRIASLRKKYGSALHQQEAAVKQQPGNAALSYRLGKTYQALGMTAGAIRQYEKTLERNPDMPHCLNDLAGLYLKFRQLEKATRVMERLTRLLPDNPTVFYNLACLYARQEETKAALTTLQQAIQLGYNNWHHLQTDPDLAGIRDTDVYKRMLREQ